MLRARLLGFLVLFLVPTTASAGGVGFYDMTGFHLSKSAGATVGPFLDQGGGIELFLGRKDFRLEARFRFAYNAIIKPGGPVVHTGTLSAGARVELLTDLARPGGVYLAADIGVSPLVKDFANYFWVQAGPGVRVRPAEHLQLFAELSGFVRFQYGVAGGLLLTLGVRFPFD
jgi:hypothetical protein